MPVSRAGVGGWAVLLRSYERWDACQASRQKSKQVVGTVSQELKRNLQAGESKWVFSTRTKATWGKAQPPGAGQVPLCVICHCLTEQDASSRAHLQPLKASHYNDCSTKMSKYPNLNPEGLWPTADSSHWQLHSHRLQSTEWGMPSVTKSHIHTAWIKIYCKKILPLILWTEQ